MCGNTVLWKGSETTPLVSIATTRIIAEVLEKNKIPGAVASLCCGDSAIGKALAADPRIKLLSFTGSCAVGNQVFQNTFGKVACFALPCFDLGGN